jgi:hypothetical protein
LDACCDVVIELWVICRGWVSMDDERELGDCSVVVFWLGYELDTGSDLGEALRWIG